MRSLADDWQVRASLANGLLAASAVAWTLGVAGCKPPGECGGFCGLGTRCEADKCVPNEPDEEPEAEVEDDGKGTRNKRRGRRRKGRPGDGDGGEAAAGLTVDDSHVPKYDPNRTETIGEGTERLSDRRVRQHLSKLEPKFNRCIEQAAMATDDALTGVVYFNIGIEPTGKVWGVTVKAPAALTRHKVAACMRVAVYKTKFPSWDGPSMGVDYSFEVG